MNIKLLCHPIVILELCGLKCTHLGISTFSFFNIYFMEMLDS